EGLEGVAGSSRKPFPILPSSVLAVVVLPLVRGAVHGAPNSPRWCAHVRRAIVRRRSPGSRVTYITRAIVGGELVLGACAPPSTSLGTRAAPVDSAAAAAEAQI